MKIICQAIMIICFSACSTAQNNYLDQWKRVSEFEGKGLTKSAAALVDSIYSISKSENSQKQLVKALIYKSKYMLSLEEEAQLGIVNQFKAEIQATESLPTKHLLENMLATMYWQYFQQNRYQFYNRSETAVKPSEDFRTWDLTTLFREIHRYYQRSLSNGVILQQEKLEEYATLLIEQKGSKAIRPTLYDLLSHNALSFYKTDENSITQPALRFEINDSSYLSLAQEFIALELTSKDSTSLQLNALKIYQNLMRFHNSKRTNRAFVEIDIERLRFIEQFATLEDKTDVFLTTLKASAERLDNNPLAALYNYEIASTLVKQGNSYGYNRNSTDGTSKSRWKLKEAYTICNETIAQFPDSEGAKRCASIKNQILHPELQLSLEQFIPVNKPSKLLVSFKNIESLNFKVFKVKHEEIKSYEKLYGLKAQNDFFRKLKPQITLSQNLPNEGDYQKHSTEIVVPKLTHGQYIIKAETENDSGVFATSSLQVTDLALVENRLKSEHVYQTINRNNGKPIREVKVVMRYNTNTNVEKRLNTITDQYGKFSFPRDNNFYRNAEFKVDDDGRISYFGDYYLRRQFKDRRKNDLDYRTFLFTDRSIYRPGQVLYFKGIVTQTDNLNQQTAVVDNQSIKASLHNANGEELSMIELRTNEFGSLQGQFVLPSSGLTGQFFIKSNSDIVGGGYAYFSVEEYKRPKFKVDFQPITNTYKINDNITITGSAKAFAGSNISNAKVVYRVSRKARFPNWYYWRRPYWNTKTQEITFGETQTDENGEFDIEFIAIPDSDIPKDQQPIFNYEIIADITDVNGETRSAKTIVNIGYHAMTLNIVTPKTIDKTARTTNIEIKAKNLNGEIVNASGTVKLYKLQAPKVPLRPRPWQAPDYQVLTQTEYKALFPNEPYGNEDQMTQWNKGKEVYSSKFNTLDSERVILKRTRKWDSGHYLIEVESEDKFGQKVESKTIVLIYSDNDKSVPDNVLFEAKLDKDSYDLGEVAQLSIGSAAKLLSVTVEVEKDHNILFTQIIELNNEKKVIPIPVSASDMGGFVVHCSYAAFNHFGSERLRINVPYPKTELQIETQTFRDKLDPNKEETWSFIIKGPKGEKVSAELLASMYDASLDEFLPHNWNFSPLRDNNYYSEVFKNAGQSFKLNSFRQFNQFNLPQSFAQQSFDQLNWFGFYFGSNMMYLAKNSRGRATGVVALQEAPADAMAVSDATFSVQDDREEIENEIPIETDGQSMEKETGTTSIQIRKNLKETAFFFPQLQTDKDGNVSFSFTTPEVLTQWKLQLLAHTKTLESSISQMEAVTQKELMVIPNMPRFLRHGDKISISTKIANLTNKTINGEAQLELRDPISGEDLGPMIQGELGKNYTLKSEVTQKHFDAAANGNTEVSWVLNIPEGIRAIQYTITAVSIDQKNDTVFSDGEQGVLPVLSNRKLVTETLPMWINSNSEKEFRLDKLVNTTSKSLKHHKLSLEMTSNPAWYAIQALPYLMEYPYECNEQIFARYYANATAQHILKSNPKIKAVFEQWSSKDALQSNLEKNPELKSLLIQETPWLRDAQTETEQKKRIAVLFDINTLSNELLSSQLKLKANQNGSGGWAWFKGGYDNRYITQHIVAGFGHLKHLGIAQHPNDKLMVQSAFNFLDKAFVKDFKDLKRHNPDVDLDKDHLSYIQLHYLYARSFYPELQPSKEVEDVMDYYRSQIKQYWLKRSLYAKGLMALALNRSNDSRNATAILNSLKENSITNPELGMYWKENTNSWHWYQAPIETQALMIEVFSEISSDIKTVDLLKIWLLKHKQTNRWPTTKATTKAVYALLLQGSDWLSIDNSVEIEIGGEPLSSNSIEPNTIEAGSGYFKTSWSKNEIEPKMGNVNLSNTSKTIAWGALYWQYFEDLDKITTAETPLSLSKSLYLKSNTVTGEVITKITPDTELAVGDLIRVRIELKTDRPMEFIHLKDMRASGLEPINVLSRFKWQDGLGYYESTKDAATHFFIDYLPKGIFIFEYDLRVNNAGSMSNGISSIQSMYAPEFSSHSEGIRIETK